jgi:hypothetical protein
MFAEGQLHLQLDQHLAGDLVLQGEQVLDRAVETVGPKVASVANAARNPVRPANPARGRNLTPGRRPQSRAGAEDPPPAHAFANPSNHVTRYNHPTARQWAAISATCQVARRPKSMQK